MNNVLLTTDQIDAMEAGAELDRLVAEAIGWTATVNRGRYWDGFPPGAEPSVYNIVAVPNYSSDIAAAWKVVEAMRSKGWFWDARDVVEVDEVLVVFHSADRPDGFDGSPSLPLSICRAALKALLPEHP